MADWAQSQSLTEETLALRQLTGGDSRVELVVVVVVVVGGYPRRGSHICRVIHDFLHILGGDASIFLGCWLAGWDQQ